MVPSNDVQAPSRIEKTPGVCGGDARVRNTRHTVTGLVEWKRLGLKDAQILERHLDLNSSDLEAAWSYSDRNRDEIERAIRENESASLDASAARDEVVEAGS